jgi:leucyl aminopeptidase
VTQLQAPPRLTIEPVTSADYEIEYLIRPQVVTDDPGPGEPSKSVGDTLLVSGDELWLLISVGVPEKLNPSRLRKAGRSASKWLLDHKAASAGLNPLDLSDLGIDNALDAFCEGLLLGAFRFVRHKSKPGDVSPVVVQVLIDGDDPGLQTRIAQLSDIASGVNLAREWSHEPPNVINPLTLAERAKSLAAETGLNCRVFGIDELTEMGAGAILSVGLGSKTPSQMIMLEHPGSGKGAGTPPVVVVGKAITFDTGGYSLKPTKSMVGMKFDKCGGMAVAGIMKTVSDLNLPVPVIGIIAAAENMISSYAYRPNDIITSLSGKTIEIISTDAEGRMVLSDALTYASTELEPRAIIDLATLTGGVVTALGKIRAGLMSNDDVLAETLAVAGERTGERLWRLPLDEEYFELIQGSDCDLKNSAGVPLASSIVGGTFLKQFVVGEVPWAHIDIAGVATIEKGESGGKSATGFGVRLVLDYLRSLSI